MTIDALPPGLVLILGGLLLPLLRGHARDALALLVPLAVIWLVWRLPDGVLLTSQYLGYELTPLKVDSTSRVFALIFSLTAFAGALFALRQARTVELSAALVYAGAALGVTFAGDLMTLFIFWEVMALASTMVIWAAATPEAYKASIRYLIIHLLGGVLLMAGVALHVMQTGDLAFRAMTLEGPASWLILLGFLVNVAAPPLSSWLPDAYPEASPSGAVFLSAFTTKAAVYVLLRGFPGTELLIYVGLFMIFYGILYALLENDMRRILAYSIVSQVGFMVTGVGIGTEMALNGVTAHAFAHIGYKALLLMSAGSVLYMTGRRRCTELGGLFRSMPLTCLCGLVGALAISAFPWTSGFVSKSMISQSAADQHMAYAWFLLTAASAGTFLYAGIKLPWFVFFNRDSGLRPPDPPLNMRLAMILFAVLCIAVGVWPEPLYALLPYPVEYVPYTAEHLVAVLQLLLFGGLVFFLMRPLIEVTRTISVDWDWFYRVAGKRLVLGTIAAIASLGEAIGEKPKALVGGWIDRLLHLHGPQGALARTWTTGGTAFTVILLFGLMLLISYL